MGPLDRILLAAAIIMALEGMGRLSGARAQGGTIRGSVHVRRTGPLVVRRPNVPAFGAPEATGTPDRAQSVVYLESAPRGAFEPSESGHAVMNQHNETFVPHVLAITVGTVVDFPNSDHIYHNVFSLSRTARFDLGRYAAGHSKSVRFDRPGVVRVFCDIHSHMNAFILVFSHGFFSVTEDDGQYHIDAVPPGTYTVVAWNEGNTSEKMVTVTGDGPVDVDFTPR
jgi:plastocyanin